MKTKSKKLCNKSCGCPAPKKSHQNGKGDKPRPLDKNQYNKNYETINWKKR